MIGRSLCFLFLVKAQVVLAMSLNCSNNFHYRSSWLGGDAAYSVVLGDNRILWLFGDTFLKENESSSFTPRTFNTIIANSLAVSDCNGNMSYYYGNDGGDYFKHPQADSGKKYWPKAGFVYDNVLYIFLLEVKHTTGGGVGFQETATVLAKIANFDQPISQWQYKYIHIAESEILFPATALTLINNDLMLLSTVKNDSAVLPNASLHLQPIVLLKLNLGALSHHEKVQTSLLNHEDHWVEINTLNDQDIKDKLGKAKTLMNSGSTEMSLTYNKTMKKWIVFYSGAPLLFPDIFSRQAKSLTGPWSDEKSVFNYPETQSDDPKFVPESYCYAAKAHNFLYDEASESFTLTYVCNTFNLFQIANNDLIYTPRFISIPLTRL